MTTDSRGKLVRKDDLVSYKGQSYRVKRLLGKKSLVLEPGRLEAEAAEVTVLYVPPDSGMYEQVGPDTYRLRRKGDDS